ncbi:MAG: FAD:protein FMN transferase [Bacillota bacterium]|nr:FAD:protein FMN transferase [Bacillota bacterium]
MGLQDPFSSKGQYLGVIEIINQSVVSSGDYVRYFEQGNRRYHHILDLRTGYSSNSGLSSATVIANNSIAADALSTAIFIMGLEEGIELINNMEGIEAIFFTKKKKVYATEGIRKQFLLVEDKMGFKYI